MHGGIQNMCHHHDTTVSVNANLTFMWNHTNRVPTAFKCPNFTEHWKSEQKNRNSRYIYSFLLDNNKRHEHFKKHEANMQDNLQPPFLGGTGSAGALGPCAPGPDWFSNKEWTAAPGTLDNCHICHPQNWAEGVSASGFGDLIGQSYQTLNCGSRAASCGDPYPAHSENEESLRETERH